MESEVTTGAPNEGEFFIGNPLNFWRFSNTHGFDLTRQKDNQSGAFVHLETTTTPILIDPNRSALIIIDMQNFFLHPSVRSHETGLLASKQLLNNAIPAARKVNLQIIWLNWGLTEEDIEQAPPGLKRIFGLRHLEEAMRKTADPPNASRRIYTGFGTPMGKIRFSNGEEVDAGRLLMRDSWNAKLYDPLFHSFEESQISGKPDQWFHKNRTSGLWTDQSPLLAYLHQNNLSTLFFAGVNTDQCVSGTLHDAFNKGFDCILIRDGCGTSSPAFARQTVEYNCAGGNGFIVDSEIFAKCIDASSLLSKT